MDDNDNLTKNLGTDTKHQDVISVKSADAYSNRLHGNNNGHSSKFQNVDVPHIGRIKKRGTQMLARRCRSLEIDYEIGGACVCFTIYLFIF